jgi:hypothetical protein
MPNFGLDVGEVFDRNEMSDKEEKPYGFYPKKSYLDARIKEVLKFDIKDAEERKRIEETFDKAQEKLKQQASDLMFKD